MSETWIQGGIGVLALGVLYKIATSLFGRLISHFDKTHRNFTNTIERIHAEHRQERIEMRDIHQQDRIRWEHAHRNKFTHEAKEIQRKADMILTEVKSAIKSTKDHESNSKS